MVSILFASFFFGLMVLIVKILSATLPAGEILFVRAAIGIVIICFFLIYRRKGFKVRNRNMLILRGLSGGFAVFLYFSAISRIPLSSASMLANSYPLFATLFAAFMLKERPNFDTIISLCVAFCGLFLILDPAFGTLDVGHLLGLISGIFGGIAVTSIRELRKTDNSWIIVLAQMVGAAFFCVPTMVLGFRMPALSAWGWLILIGIVGTIAQVAFTRPFKYIPTSEASVVALAHAAFAVLFAVIFLGEVLTLQFILGAALVFGSSFYLMYREERKAPQ